MGNLNEIQKQTTQSYGDNSFTTTIKENTVEFDSAKDSFTFNDEVNVPSLKVNGQEITPTEPQVQADWGRDDNSLPDFIKNKPAIKAGQGENSNIEGDLVGNSSAGRYSHTEGQGVTASGENSHAEGYNTTASGDYGSHAEGYGAIANDGAAHAEGNSTTASGVASHAEGSGTIASADYSHAEGRYTTASGDASHAEGNGTTASGVNSHAEGRRTIAKNKNQHVFGEYNIADPSKALSDARGTYVEIVGKGVDDTARSNARTLDWSGNETLAGNLTIGGASGATLKVESGALKVSFDGGTTWLTVSAS